MTLPRTRKISISVALALAAIAQSGVVHATQTGPKLSLDSATMLSPSSLQSESEAASFVSADRIEGNPEDQLVLSGNAEIRRGGSVLRGDRITYTQATDEVEASGDARISRQGASFSGPSMRFRLTSRTGEMTDAEYEYAPRNIRGCAKNIRFISGDKTTLEDATITTCKRDDEDWYLKINSLEIDEYDQMATGTGASFHFMGIPVMGLPWITFPISNERRSGFLTPTYGMSTGRGVDISVPYYFNIAPNYDMTLTPRLMTKRGVMLETESRFLYNGLTGTLNYDYLPDDDVFKDDRYSVRYLGDYSHGKLSAHIDYNRVSDDEYVSDFSGNVRESSESVLPQEYFLRYDEKFWNLSLNVTKNQTLDVEGITYYKPYEREPQIQLNSFVGDWYGWEIATNLEATKFTSATRVEGSRFVIDQSVSYPIREAGWFLVPKAGFLGTWYNLDNLDRSHYSDKNPNRTLPIFSLDAGLMLDRDSSWFGRDAYQTLEPRLFYAYIPYRNQDAIPIFDSTIADLNFATLFSENTFSGYDRISEANQLTVAFTTRYIDKQSGVELFRAALGQRQYFDDQRVGFPDLNNSTHASQLGLREGDNRSDLLASVGARLTRTVTANANAQYSSSDSKFVKVNTGLRWQPKPYSIVGLYYRYNYSSETVSNEYYDDNIKQVDLAAQWPITDRLYTLFRYNYSLKKSKPIEMMAGVEYLHDCWTLRFVTQRYTTASNSEESNFFLQLELNGLGSIGSSPLSELKRNIKGYQSATQVPNQIGQYDYYE